MTQNHNCIEVFIFVFFVFVFYLFFKLFFLAFSQSSFSGFSGVMRGVDCLFFIGTSKHGKQDLKYLAPKYPINAEKF